MNCMEPEDGEYSEYADNWYAHVKIEKKSFLGQSVCIRIQPPSTY